MKPIRASGVNLKQNKEPALSNKLLRVPVPDELKVPLFNFDRGAMLPIPRAGETVAKYSMLAHSKNGTCWTVTPCAGKLTHIERFAHPLMGKVMCAHIRTGDGGHEVQLVPHNPSAMTPDGILRCIAQACIIDEVDGTLVHRKLQKAMKNGTMLIVADCIDDSPYVSSSLRVIMEYGDMCADGVSVVMKLLGGAKAKLAVYNPGGIDMENLLDRVGFLDTVEIKGGYPAWFTFEREYCHEQYVRIGVQALRAISLAVRQGMPQTEFVVTVAGDCVSAPVNAIVTTGTTVADVFDAVGLECEPDVVLIGDPMTGVIAEDPETPLFAGIRSVIAMKKIPEKPANACIGCGRCVSVCPRHLFPSEAVRMAEQKKLLIAAEYGARRCMGCGACSAVCPSGIEITELMKKLRRYAEKIDGEGGADE